MEKSGYGRDGIYRSLRPPLNHRITTTTTTTTTTTSMISFLFRNISSYPNKPALHDSNTNQTLSFSSFKTSVSKLSHSLHTLLHISQNDVVLILSPNSILYPVTVYSVIALGAVVTTCNPLYTVHEISKQIHDSKPKLIVTVKDLFHKVASFGIPVVFLDDNSLNKDCFSYQDLILASGSVSELPKVDIDINQPAALLYSSGTTGVSKGVVLSHMNFIAVSQMIASDQRLMGEKDYVFLCFLPMFHIFGFGSLLYAQLQEGNTIVSMERFEFKEMLRNIEKYRVTHLWVVPPVFLALAKQDVVGEFDLSSLKQIGSGAAPLGKELMEECVRKLPHVVALQV